MRQKIMNSNSLDLNNMKEHGECICPHCGEATALFRIPIKIEQDTIVRFIRTPGSPPAPSSSIIICDKCGKFLTLI